MIYGLKCKSVKVRKRHRCVWCGEYIEVGEPAQYRVYVYDDNFCSDHYHPDCWEALNTYPWDSHDDGFDEFTFKRGSHDEKWSEEAI